jgi:hypothetical protein
VDVISMKICRVVKARVRGASPIPFELRIDIP